MHEDEGTTRQLPAAALPLVRVPAPRLAPDVLAPDVLAPDVVRAGPARPRPAVRSWDGASRARLGGAPAVARPTAKVAAAAPPAAFPATVRRTGWVDHLLTALAVLGLAVTALTIAATVVGLRPLVVRSGSMEPGIPTGAMVLVRAVAPHDVRVGDVVTVDRPDGVRITHRVLRATPRGAAVELQLKGDANDTPDPDPVVVTKAARLVWSAPAVGRLSAELASARGGFVVGCLVTAGVLGARRRT